jgi:SHS2 domain-containing protein
MVQKMSLDVHGCTTEELAHTSEIGLRAHAASLGDLFSCLCRAMISLTGAQADAEAESLTLEVDVSAVDVESLLVDWLNEVLYLHEVTGVVPQAVAVHAITPRSIQATISGHAAREPSELQIKAVTYHQLLVVQENGEWKAEVFFDI